MKMKPILFALIAAAVGGVVQDATEKGLCAFDKCRSMRKAEGTEDESETTDTAEEEEEEDESLE